MLILASASPRRRELLAQAGYRFEVQAASIVEARLAGEDGISMAARLAQEKAEAVFASRQAAVQPAGQDSLPPEPLTQDSLTQDSLTQDPLFVLGADTIVVCDGEVLGKPVDVQDAARMLALLSGRTHQVVTGVALVSGSRYPGTTEVVAELTHVTMRTLSAAEISRYVETGEPMDKAGSYGIQGYAGRWISRINGCYFNVVGLPLALVSEILEGAQLRFQ